MGSLCWFSRPRMLSIVSERAVDIVRKGAEAGWSERALVGVGGFRWDSSSVGVLPGRVAHAHTVASADGRAPLDQPVEWH